MKKFISLVLAVVCLFGLSLHSMAATVKSLTFNGSESLVVVTNTLKSGGAAKLSDGVLSLDGTYGIKLGYVGSTFSVSAMVKVSSTGGTSTIFFKDMDNVGNKWTGVLSNGKKPSFWTHGTNHRWETVASGDANLGEWSHVAYVENNAVGSLYVNGELVGSGSVEAGAGDLYLGATYWSADALAGYVDDVKLYNNALTANEVLAEYEQCIDFENFINLPKEVISDIELIEKIASKNVTWTSNDESVIDATGKVTRADEDKIVTLVASIDTGIIGEFEVKVLKKPVIVNEDVLLSYTFGATDGEIIHDVSGNGNHGAAYGNVEIGANGAVFDGADDYIKMPEGVLYGHDEITIVTTFTQNSAQRHVFLYGFGNSADTGYMFLNPSRPDTNLLRFAATKTNAANEHEVASLPGVRNNEKVTVVVVINGRYASMYVNGELVMDGEIGLEVSDLGKTAQNYIGKSLYEADPYFNGVIEEFTVYGYCMSDTEIAVYKNDIEYALDGVDEEYITSVSFADGIKVEVDTLERDDVKIAAVVLDENNEVIEFCVVNPTEELSLTKEGTVCVFAYNEADNIPGGFFVKGKGEGFSFEYVPGKVYIVSEQDYNNGMMIVAGYDTAGVLTGVAFKVVDVKAGERVELNGDFDSAVEFRLLYWDNLVSMAPAK